VDTFILDASVGVKWFFHEEASDKALTFLERLDQKKIRIVVPEIFYMELASACWKREKKREISEEYAIKIPHRIESFSLEKYPDYELFGVALDNALHYEISVYDAVYLSLAEIYLAPLVTADQMLLKACQGRFDFIESLRDVKIR